MNPTQILHQILSVIQTIKEDKTKLTKLHGYVMEEFYVEDEELVIPEKYKKLVHDITDSIGSGLVCFLNTDTMECVDFPQEILDDLSLYDDEGKTEKEPDSINGRENTLRYEPLEPGESFKIMERFTNQLTNKQLQNKLSRALHNRRPFANFKSIVDNSDQRQEWFAFKQNCLEKIVFGQMEIEW